MSAAPCDGGLQIARLDPGEDEDTAARRYGGSVRCYGRGCHAEPGRQMPHTLAGATRCLAAEAAHD